MPFFAPKDRNTIIGLPEKGGKTFIAGWDFKIIKRGNQLRSLDSVKTVQFFRLLSYSPA